MTTRELLYQIEYALAAEVITLEDEVILVGAGNRKSGYSGYSYSYSYNE